MNTLTEFSANFYVEFELERNRILQLWKGRQNHQEIVKSLSDLQQKVNSSRHLLPSYDLKKINLNVTELRDLVSELETQGESKSKFKFKSKAGTITKPLPVKSFEIEIPDLNATVNSINSTNTTITITK